MVAAVGTSVGLPMNTTSCCGPVERQDGGKWGSWSWTLPRWFEIGSIKSLLPVRDTGHLRRRGLGCETNCQTKGRLNLSLALPPILQLQKIICLVKTYHRAAFIQWRAVGHIESVGVI